MQKNILINGISLDGASLTALLAKAKYWTRCGLRVTFIGSSLLKQRITQEIKSDNFEYIEIGKGFKKVGKIIFIFRALQNNLISFFILKKIRGKFDVVYSISSVLDLMLLPFLLKYIDKQIKWVTVFDNIVPLSAPGNKTHRLLAWIFFKVSIQLLKRADSVFAISTDLKAFLISRGIKRKNIIITGNAIELEALICSKKNMALAYDALFVGRINEAKGIYDALEVLLLVKERFPKFKLGIMGEGDPKTESNFKSAIIRMGLEKNVFLLGYKTGVEKFSIIKSCKSFWFLSANESFGVALLEAVCCGIPAFAYDLPAYRSIYKHNEVSISPTGNCSDVAKRVIKLFEGNIFENDTGKHLLNYDGWDKIAEKELATFV
jgi:glycosyltransferase involved in cell wall biosynthesis